jgi:hypothetical protein
MSKPKPNYLKVTMGDQRRKLIEQLAKQEKRSLSSMVVVLVDEALAARGLQVPEEEEEQ